MAASGSTTIQLYNSSTASAVPTSGNLAQGELGINVTDKKIYTKNGSGVVVMVGFGPDASVALTNLVGLTVVSGGASISGNLSVSGQLTTTDNVGIGATPDAWAAGHRVAEFGTVANSVAALVGGDFNLTNNAFLGGSGWVYKLSAGATRFQQDFGVSRWLIDSGTKNAGAACNFVTAMTLDASGNLSITNGAIGRSGASGLFFNTNSVLPGTGTGANDNANTLGAASYRWTTVYATTGTINTSDARAKTKVRTLADAEIEAAIEHSKEIGIFQWLDAVAKKGEKARQHIGMTVQRSIEIMESHGLDPMSYAFICHDVWDDEFKEHPAIPSVEAKDAVLDDEGNEVEPAIEAVEGKDAWTEQTQTAGDRYAFRYDQLNLFIARGIEARLAALEARA